MKESASRSEERQSLLMTRRRLAQCLSGTVCLFGVLCAGSTLAECTLGTPLAIEADSSVRARWPYLVDRLRDAFDARDDIDRCARVELSSHGGAVMVDVALPDGRSAARSVSRQEDVAPTLDALLLLPERGVDRSLVSSVTPVTTPAVTSAASAPKSVPPPLVMDPASNRSLVARDHASSGRSRAEPPAHLRIELSLLAGARVGDGHVGAGLGALSLLDVGGWLFGIEGRVDRYRRNPENDQGAFEVAALAGRRFRFESVALDVAAGPAAAFQGTTTLETQSTVTRNSVIESSSSTVPRLLVDSRLTFGAASTLRTFVAVDGDVGPRRMGSLDLPGAPRLPLWTVGLAIGATVGTQ
jgi:hypothetical protein